MRQLAIMAVAVAALLAPSICDAQSQQRSERNDRSGRRAERTERRERVDQGASGNAAERARPANQRALECPAEMTCRMICMWSGGRREYENVRTATVTYAPGGSGAMEVSVRTDEGQPLGMVFGMGMTCIGESIRATGGP